jgi:hypothetical protein
MESILLTRTPGIGMTLFVIYQVWYLLRESRNKVKIVFSYVKNYCFESLYVIQDNVNKFLDSFSHQLVIISPGEILHFKTSKRFPLFKL